MTDPRRQYAVGLIHRSLSDRPKQSPADWCCENLIFDEPDNRGPFSLLGREFMREIVDTWADPSITDQVPVMGTQLGKTAGIMGGAAWTVVNQPTRIFWVMPTRPTLLSFSRSRWQPMCRKSFPHLIPKASKRHDFSTFEQVIGGSIVDMRWSNSPAALSSVPARVVILDEVDKFDEGGGKEADAVDLSEQRTKSFSNPKRIKTSSPTLATGLIWQAFGKTDQRRRFMPCPYCGKFVVLIWSKQYTVFKLTGEEAEVYWDKEAKRADGSWDLERVEKSAHYRCPHCAGRILDGHKTAMDRDGIWRPTSKAAAGCRGWHLPSLYGTSAETNVGTLAVKFLQKKASLLGLQGFINGDLAEPYMAQDTLRARVELVTSRVEITAEWRKLMTADSQHKSPHFWHVVRAWNGGNSRAIQAGPTDTWDDLRTIQTNHGIPDVCVAIDSGFGAKSDAEIYKNCLRFSELIEDEENEKAIAIGWMPSKGMPGRKRWKDPESELLVPWFLWRVDPFMGTAHAGEVSLNLFEVASDFFKDLLQNLRDKKTGYEWSVEDKVSNDEYWRHMDGEIKTAVVNKATGRTTYEWRKRASTWPNHLFDAEVLQVAFAAFHKLFPIE